MGCGYDRLRDGSDAYSLAACIKSQGTAVVITAEGERHGGVNFGFTTYVYLVDANGVIARRTGSLLVEPSGNNVRRESYKITNVRKRRMRGEIMFMGNRVTGRPSPGKFIVVYTPWHNH
ncbi:hypothetical protein NSQ26_05955 [Bacillus sp. FSL W7-1360]